MAKIQSENALMGASSFATLYQIACAEITSGINLPCLFIKNLIVKKTIEKIISSVTAVTFAINYLFTPVSIGGAK